MTSREMICPMCGSQYDPDSQVACKACPLQKNCQLVCCPVCGYETMDPARSLLARLAARWLSPDAPAARVNQERANVAASSQRTRSTGR